MIQIPLNRGLFALIDDVDAQYLMQFDWRAILRKKSNTYYAARYVGKNRSRQLILMHREIMKPQRHEIVDHIDGNGLNNTRENLRIATPSENVINSQRRKDNKSGYKGVTWSARHNKWRARIIMDGKFLSLGYFADPIEAAKAYDQKALELFGEFARVNFPEETK